MRSHSSTPVFGLGLLALAACVTACHHRAPVVSPSVTPAAPMAPARVAPPPLPPAPAPAPAPRPLTEEEIFARESLEQLNSARPLTDAFFDYDSATIRPDAQASLAKDAGWLQRWPTTKITVSGHCDERGTAE